MGAFITFKINDENDFKSMLGGFCSMFFVIFCIFYVIYSAVPFLKKENINFIYATKVLDSNPRVDFGMKQMMLALSLYYQDAEYEAEFPACYETEGILGYRMFARVWEGDDDVKDYPIPTDYCKKEDFPEELWEFFDGNSMETMHCPNLSVFPKELFNLQGLYTDYYLKYFIMEVYITDEAKEDFEFVQKAMAEQLEFGM